MIVVKDNIYRNVEKSELKKYLDMGFKTKGCIEPQPNQTDLYIIDDYTIAKKDNL